MFSVGVEIVNDIPVGCQFMGRDEEIAIFLGLSPASRT